MGNELLGRFRYRTAGARHVPSQQHDQLAPFVNATTGAEIEAYENDEDDLLVPVLRGYAKLAIVPVENLIYDDRDLLLGIGENGLAA